ncbi:translation initiation factor IF-2-like [Oxyura jamaicensis]|uniref:translation initiation factor IF-2-like n=1 Tax=Oxyura jamaicensis TaxID=8884 RepID=UPI0015A636DF|nr:translation initiation factor IF-2-like [Oxyura jamaicensis]
MPRGFQPPRTSLFYPPTATSKAPQILQPPNTVISHLCGQIKTPQIPQTPPQKRHFALLQPKSHPEPPPSPCSPPSSSPKSCPPTLGPQNIWELLVRGSGSPLSPKASPCWRLRSKDPALGCCGDKASRLRGGVQAHVDAHSTHPWRGRASSPAHGGHRESGCPRLLGRGNPGGGGGGGRAAAESRGLGAATSIPVAPAGKQKAPLKKSMKAAELGVLLNVSIHIFHMICGFIVASSHPRLPSPHRHLRISTPRFIFTGTGKGRKKKSSRYLQRFGNNSSSPSRGLRAHLVILQGLKTKNKSPT